MSSDAAALLAPAADASGALMIIAATTITTKIVIARILNVEKIPYFAMNLVTTLPRASPPRPNPMSIIPEARPTLSGNHLVIVVITALYPTPTPPPPNTP